MIDILMAVTSVASEKCDVIILFFFFQAEDGIRDFCLSRGLGDVYKRQCQWYSKSVPQTRRLTRSCSEILRSRFESPGNPAPARNEPGAILDANRRHAERRLALRERPRNAAAREGVAAARARRADRSFAGEACRLRDHQLPER